MALWNLWHGCHKISEGCKNCYVYRRDEEFDKDSSVVCKTKNFDLPVRKNRRGEYKLLAGETVFTCFTSDFFVEDADEWRPEAWRMIKEREDLDFFIITKRIARFESCIPPDWGSGYKNVAIACTVENQKMADFRLPIYLNAPIAHKQIVCAPLLECIDLSRYLCEKIESVTVGGESGNAARVCDYTWVLDMREQCIREQVPFHFQQTGAMFKKDGRLYRIPRKLQAQQAKKAKADYFG